MLTLSRDVVETRLHELQRDLERDPEGFLRQAFRQLKKENPAIHDLVRVFLSDVSCLREEAKSAKELSKLLKVHLVAGMVVVYRAMNAQMEVNDLNKT